MGILLITVQAFTVHKTTLSQTFVILWFFEKGLLGNFMFRNF